MARKRVTARGLEQMGYQGFQQTSSGEAAEAPWALEFIAMAANNCPGSLRFSRDTGARKVRVDYEMQNEEKGVTARFFAVRKMLEHEVKRGGEEHGASDGAGEEVGGGYSER